MHQRRTDNAPKPGCTEDAPTMRRKQGAPKTHLQCTETRVHRRRTDNASKPGCTEDAPTMHQKPGSTQDAPTMHRNQGAQKTHRQCTETRVHRRSTEHPLKMHQRRTHNAPKPGCTEDAPTMHRNQGAPKTHLQCTETRVHRRRTLVSVHCRCQGALKTHRQWCKPGSTQDAPTSSVHRNQGALRRRTENALKALGALRRHTWFQCIRRCVFGAPWFRCIVGASAPKTHRQCTETRLHEVHCQCVFQVHPDATQCIETRLRLRCTLVSVHCPGVHRRRTDNGAPQTRVHPRRTDNAPKPGALSVTHPKCTESRVHRSFTDNAPKPGCIVEDAVNIH